MADTFQVAVYEPVQARGLAPMPGMVARRMQSVDPSVFEAALQKFAGGLGGLLARLPQPGNGARLVQVSATVEVSAEGSVAFVAGASVGASGSMTLTYDLSDSKE